MTTDTGQFDEQVSGVAALDNEVSRAVYRLVLEEPWLSRDRAGERLGVARSVAAFHLEKLEQAGLLTSRFARTSGRTGPGAGRPAKLYGRSDLEIDLSLPPRRYALAGAVLADAVVRAEADGVPIAAAVESAAREEGLAIGRTVQAPKRPSAGKALEALADALGRHGFEPRADRTEVALHNCPFHALAERHRGLVCGMNTALLSGVVEGAGLDGSVSAVLDPEPGMCCVRLRAGKQR